MPFNAVAIPAAHPTTVYVCCDVGVLVSTDEGDTWANLTHNLPNVMVVDLVRWPDGWPQVNNGTPSGSPRNGGALTAGGCDFWPRV